MQGVSCSLFDVSKTHPPQEYGYERTYQRDWSDVHNLRYMLSQSVYQCFVKEGIEIGARATLLEHATIVPAKD